MENQEKKCKFCLESMRDCKCKKWLYKIIFTLLVLFGLALVVGYGVKTYGKYTNPRSISISGVGEITAVPDISTINFTVRADSQDANTKDLQDKVAKSIDNVVAKLKTLGIADKDIKTENYSINPKYGYQNCASSIRPCEYNSVIGYEASENVSVKVRNTENTSKVLTVLADEKITEVSGPNLEIEDLQKLKDKARLEAIKDAKSKAKILAKSLGVKLEKIISFSDNSDGGYAYTGNMKAMNSMVAAPEVARDANIQQGEQKITSNVTISFEIDD